MRDRHFKSADSAGAEIELVFKRPSQKLISEGDFVYRKEFSKAIRKGIMTNAEGVKVLKENGIIGDEYNEKEASLRLKISDTEDKFKGDITEDEGKAIYLELKQLREELSEHTRPFISITDNTAESVASEGRTYFFAAECSVYKDSNKKVFSSADEIVSRLDEKIALDCYRQAVLFNYEHLLGIELPDELDDASPEDAWLKTLETQEPDKTVKDEELEKEENKVEKPKRRGGRKKKTVETTE